MPRTWQKSLTGREGDSERTSDLLPVSMEGKATSLTLLAPVTEKDITGRRRALLVREHISSHGCAFSPGQQIFVCS